MPAGQRHLGSLSHREGEGNLEQLERSWGNLKARAAGEEGGWPKVGRLCCRSKPWRLGGRCGWEATYGRRKDSFPDYVMLERDSVVDRILR